MGHIRGKMLILCVSLKKKTVDKSKLVMTKWYHLLGFVQILGQCCGIISLIV